MVLLLDRYSTNWLIEKAQPQKQQRHALLKMVLSLSLSGSPLPNCGWGHCPLFTEHFSTWLAVFLLITNPLLYPQGPQCQHGGCVCFMVLGPSICLSPKTFSLHSAAQFHGHTSDLVILSNYSVSEITLSVILLSPQPPLLLACWFTPVMVVLWPHCNVSFIGPATFYQTIRSFLPSFSFLSSLDSITVAKPLSSLISCIFDAFAWENPNPDELSYSYFHAYIV